MLQMADAQWYDRNTLREAVRDAADLSEHPYVTDTVPERGFFIPPPIAIAHHLIKSWVEGSPASKM